MTRRWRVLAVVALMGGVTAACSDDGPGEGEARLEVDGEASVERADGDREDVDGSTDLAAGDRVEMVRGTAVMQLQGGTSFELREGLGDADSTQVLMASPPVLEAGDLLVTTPGSAALEADGTEVVVREGSARLTRAFGMNASAYDAELELDSAGVTTEVRALRQVAVPDLGRPRPPRPVDFVEAGPWDVRYLGAAKAFGDQLERLSEQFTGMLPSNEGRTLGFFKLILPELEAESAFTDALLTKIDPGRDRDPGDTLVGAAISVTGEQGSFADRWSDVFTFRDEGAEWGIVALDQAVQSDPLFGTVEQAFNTSVNEIAAQAPSAQPPASGEQPGGNDPGGADTPDTGGDGGTDGGTDGGDGGTDEPTPPTTPTLPPPLTPSPPTEPDEPDVVEPVVDLVDDLLGGLLG